MYSAAAKANMNLNPGYGCMLILLLMVLCVGGFAFSAHRNEMPDISVVPAYPNEEVPAIGIDGKCATRLAKTPDIPFTAMTFYNDALHAADWQRRTYDEGYISSRAIHDEWQRADLYLYLDFTINQSKLTVIQAKLCSDGR